LLLLPCLAWSRTVQKRVAVIQVSLADKPAPPAAAALREKWFTGTGSVNAFVREQTRAGLELIGKNDPTGDILGPFAIATRLADVNTSCASIFPTMDAQARQAATTAGVNLTGYDLVVFAWPHTAAETPACTVHATTMARVIYGRTDFVLGERRALGSQDLFWTLRILGNLRPSVGLRCSEAQGGGITFNENCARTTALDPFEHGEAPGIKPLSGVARALMGAYDEGGMKTIDGPDTYLLKPVDLPGPGTQVLRLFHGFEPGGGRQYLYLEHRAPAQPHSLPAGSPAFAGVTVRLVTLREAPELGPVDATPSTPTLDDAPFTAGQTLIDGPLGVQLKIESVGPEGARVKVTYPTEVVAPGNGDGLTAVYFARTAPQVPVLQRVDKTINFFWGTAAPPGVPRDDFGVRWTGFYVPRSTGKQAIRVLSDEGVRIRLDGALIIDQFDPHALGWSGVDIELTAGRAYPIEIEYFDLTGDATMHLVSWAKGFEHEAIPQSQLYSRLPGSPPDTGSPPLEEGPGERRPEPGPPETPEQSAPGPATAGCSSAPGAPALLLLLTVAMRRRARNE
jgi:hypothetical protein